MFQLEMATNRERLLPIFAGILMEIICPEDS
jgi:hypothetical protein